MAVGFSITLADPGIANTESAFAAIADALLGRDYDGTFVGGMPEWFRFDQGSDFMYGVADAIDRLGGKTQPAAANTPQHKPFVERMIGTIKANLLPRYAGYGERLGDPARSRPESKLLTTRELVTMFDRDLRELNGRPHRGLRAIPLDVYRANPIKPTRLKQEHVGQTLLRRNRTAIVQKDGVQFGGIKYQGVATFAHIGETVGLGYLETHPELLHIFGADGRWLGELEPAADAGLPLSRALVAARRRQIETVDSAQRTAEGLRSDQLAQLRGGILDDPGAKPVPDQLSVGRGTTSETEDLRRRQAQVAKNTKIWK